MTKSIFDSNSEKRIYHRLKTYWSKYVDIFPQILVKSVLGYEEIENSNINEKTKNFLLKSSFDFVVCELGTGIPILVVEFDGLSGGFSQEGKFYIKTIPENDQYRKLKTETKLKACADLQIPMIVVSYEECNLLKKSNDFITILDVTIGDALEKTTLKKTIQNTLKCFRKHMNMGVKSPPR